MLLFWIGFLVLKLVGLVVGLVYVCFYFLCCWIMKCCFCHMVSVMAMAMAMKNEYDRWVLLLLLLFIEMVEFEPVATALWWLPIINSSKHQLFFGISGIWISWANYPLECKFCSSSLMLLYFGMFLFFFFPLTFCFVG